MVARLSNFRYKNLPKLTIATTCTYIVSLSEFCLVNIAFETSFINENVSPVLFSLQSTVYQVATFPKDELGPRNLRSPTWTR